MRDRLVTAGTSALLGLLLLGCPMEQGFGVAPGGGGGGSPEEDPYWCCDPDEPFCLCEGYWHCTEGIAGKTCRQSNPQMPDGGDWVCEYGASGLTCTGRSSDHPDGGLDEGWRCTDIGEGMIECSRSSDAGDYPDGEGAGPWNCYYGPDGLERVCDQGGGEGGGPDAGEWQCREAADGTTVCVNHNPNTPDGGEWSCVQADGRDICQGSDYPDGSGGNGWDCSEQGEFVQCESGQPQQPDGGGSQPWDCTWGDGGNVLTCIQRGDDGSLGGGGGGDNGGNGDNGDNGGNPGDAGNGDNPGGGGGDDGGGGGDECVCPPNAERFCDTPTYCNWGRQVCVDDGNGNAHWGACMETNNIPGGCNFGPQFDEWAEQCAIDAGFCVQDFWDLDGDWDTNETLGRNCVELECVDDGGGGGFGGGWGF